MSLYFWLQVHNNKIIFEINFFPVVIYAFTSLDQQDGIFNPVFLTTKIMLRFPYRARTY
jgi:hypothetical protein